MVADSACASGLFGLSPLAWLYSGQAEVFALHNALTATTLLLFVCTAQADNAAAVRRFATSPLVLVCESCSDVFIALCACPSVGTRWLVLRC